MAVHARYTRVLLERQKSRRNNKTHCVWNRPHNGISWRNRNRHKQNTKRLRYKNKNIEAHLNDYAIAIAQIQEQINHIGDTQLVWNVTKGEYTDSKTALRDLYRELAVYGARVTQIADINTGKLSEHRTDETPAIGNLTIFNDTTPRVTNPTTGDKYPPLS